jgi:hypothetical protein
MKAVKINAKIVNSEGLQFKNLYSSLSITIAIISYYYLYKSTSICRAPPQSIGKLLAFQ